ncbi:MAG: NAD(P)/FAD-dependent oxidoreductase [Trueperaceae bacterium]|nr:NAD(P)/FAD-dependent oxidoreductase [Trueperaceae bacterium]
MHAPPAPVVVVGAGPAGLAVVRALARRGVATTVLERDRAAASWARHYDHLKLHTRKGAAALPGMAYPPGTPTFPRRDDVVAYLRAYAARFVPDLREGVEVQGLTPLPAGAPGTALRAAPDPAPGAAGWRLATSAGDLTARAVVVATGIASAPFTPAIPGMDAFAGPLRHAAAYRDPAADAGRRVLVVGAGNTGVDLALGLAGHAAAVDLVVRDGVALVPCPTALSQRAGMLLQALPPALTEAALRRVRRAYPELGLPGPSGALREAFPVVGLRLVEAVRDGRVGVRPGVTAFTERGAVFADGTEAAYDAVWLATGYRPAVAWAAPWLQPDAAAREGVRVADGAVALHPLGFVYPGVTSWLQALPGAVGRVAADLAVRESSRPGA